MTWKYCNIEWMEIMPFQKGQKEKKIGTSYVSISSSLWKASLEKDAISWELVPPTSFSSPI